MGRRHTHDQQQDYSSWSLRGWLMTKFSGLPFSENAVSSDDPSARDELLLLSSSFLVPCLIHDGVSVWDTLAICEYLNEIKPEAHLLPKDLIKRTRLRSICGEMHSGFGAMRSALQGDFPNFKVWKRAQADIDRRDAVLKLVAPRVALKRPGDREAALVEVVQE